MKTLGLARPRTLALLGVAILALAGCDGGGNGAHPSGSASSGPANDLRTAWLNYSACMRANGIPNYPDPQQNQQGEWAIPESAPQADDVPACDELLARAKQQAGLTRGPSASEMAARTKYADCVRQHGMPTFPDPNEEGNFELSPEERADPSLGPAREACKQYAPPQRAK